MSQKQICLKLFSEHEWVCSNVFRANYVPEFRARFNDLRIEGYHIEARTCTQHKHKGQMNEYSLKTQESAPSQLIIPTSDYCCGNKIKGLEGHSRDCRLQIREVEIISGLF